MVVPFWYNAIIRQVNMRPKCLRSANMVVPFWYNAIIRQDNYAAE